MKMAKPLKAQKCQEAVRCFRETIQSEADCLEKIYELCLAKMKETDPGFVLPVAEVEKYDSPAVPANSSIDFVNLALPVSINSAAKPQINISPTQDNGPRVQMATENPAIIKIEDSSSEESNHSLERVKTEKVVHNIISSTDILPGALLSKTLLHYIVLENLHPLVTTNDVVQELFDDLLGIKSHEVTGITVHNDKAESVAQIYFQDFRHVQKILAFNGKLVFKGRVMSSRIGTS